MGAVFWRDDLRVVRGFGVVARCLPIQHMKFALIGPITGVFDKPGADGVLECVLPFFAVVFVLAQLGVPEVCLPDGRVVGI